MREKFLFRPSPELTHVLIGLDGFVPKLETVFGAFRADAPDVEVSDYVVEVIELQRPARRVGQADGLQGGHEVFSVAGLPTCRFKCRIYDLAVDVEKAGILAGNCV